MRNAFLPTTLMNSYFWCYERWAKKPVHWLCWRDLLRHCTRWVSLATNQCGSWKKKWIKNLSLDSLWRLKRPCIQLI